ncbi:hypothetical protein AOT82_979 [Psychrobacter sp. AntiMn-1]|nr:hypothetical protein AOT82_979 [Psychrobacter sp. AntiMn-1]
MIMNAQTHGGSFNPRTRDGCENIIIYRFQFYISFNPRTRDGCEQRLIMMC